MRIRTKTCHQCSESRDALYRCRYGLEADWVFLCGVCLERVKDAHGDSYQYGGTWKSKKK